MSVNIYLDESGDTGWVFERPYTNGGSSRYLTIAACQLLSELDHKPERMLRNIYKNRSWKPGSEKKWARMSPDARTDFAKNAAKLIRSTPGIELFAIVVDKRNVLNHVRHDSNKLYNFMVKILLINEMAKHDRVTFIPDPRSLKVESSNSLHDYLQTELWFGLFAKTQLETTPCDSRYCLNLQFTDMLAGVVQSHFEFGQSRHWCHLAPYVKIKTLLVR